MRGLDDTDRRILRLLLEDARRPYSDIAEEVDLSPPAVSDRIDRLKEMGLIRRFTVDLDRSMLGGGVPVLVTLHVRPGAAPDLSDRLAAAPSVEHVFRTVDDRLVCTATVPKGVPEETLADALAADGIREYDVRPLAGSEWSPAIDTAKLAPTCVECGNTVTVEGESERIDGDVYHFCCGNCRESFLEQYDRLKEGV
jgi:DNA-binding Lrp family transcriptional regulator/YHS domain-containing protein